MINNSTDYGKVTISRIKAGHSCHYKYTRPKYEHPPLGRQLYQPPARQNWNSTIVHIHFPLSQRHECAFKCSYTAACK
jgi:hypothetical protein